MAEIIYKTEGSQTVHLDISQLKEFRLSVDKMIGDLS